MKSLLRRIYRLLFGPILMRLDQISRRCDRMESVIELNRILIVQPRIREFQHSVPANIAEAEFRVFSQWGEDGIIQYLLSKVPITNKVFVEFGVEDYRESNTRFLLMNNNWTGLVMDCSEYNVAEIRSSELYWRYDLTAKHAFITRENINQLILTSGITGDIGLLSIDVDGNDYWIWEAIDVVSPRIVIVEYNSLFGCQHPITIPYDATFNVTKAHYSRLYFGASLPALCRLAREKGYVFVGSNSAGSNAFFVRQDVAANVAPVDCATGYVEIRSRQSRDENRALTFVSGKNRIKLIADMEVHDLRTGQLVKLNELMAPY